MERDGWLFVGPALAVAALAALGYVLGWGAGLWLMLAALFIAGYLVCFFRDPVRRPPEESGVVVAPADGKIVVVASLPDGSIQIDTFLSVFDVHVNRAPVGGRVTLSEHRPGKFLVAGRPEAATQNARQDMAIDGPFGVVRFAQIVGLLARRIVCRIKPGDMLDIGDRIGLIRFGSRMEVIVPKGCVAAVKVGDRVRAGETIIARMQDGGANG